MKLSIMKLRSPIAPTAFVILAICGFTFGDDLPTKDQLIEHYRQSQAILGSHYVRTEMSVKNEIKNAGTGGKQYTVLDGVHEANAENRLFIDVEKKRFAIKRMSWGFVSPRAAIVSRADAKDDCWMFDGTKHYYYSNAGTKGSVIINDIEPKTNVLDEAYMNSGDQRAYGYFNEKLRIDAILEKATSASVRAKYDDDTHIVKCYVVDAKTPYGKYVVSFDPSHDYNICELEQTIEPGDIGEGGVYKTCKSHAHYNVKEFKQLGATWYPWQAHVSEQLTMTGTSPGMSSSIEVEIQRKELVINPDFDGLKAFSLSEIKDGAAVSIPGKADVPFTWRHGQAHADVDENVVRTIDQTVQPKNATTKSQ